MGWWEDRIERLRRPDIRPDSGEGRQGVLIRGEEARNGRREGPEQQSSEQAAAQARDESTARHCPRRAVVLGGERAGED